MVDCLRGAFRNRSSYHGSYHHLVCRGSIDCIFAGLIRCECTGSAGSICNRVLCSFVFHQTICTAVCNTVKTNIDSLIGKHARVTAEINNIEAKGAVLLNGQEWTARALKDDSIYPVGTMVEVKDIRGVKLIVSKEEEET